MKKLFASALLLFAASALQAQTTVEITLAHGTAPEKQTKAQLEQLLAKYDLTPWIFTKSVIVDEQAIPRSHPTLTLHTRHLKDDELLLSTFVHEQIHWFVTQRSADADAAATELRKLFPKLPVGYPEGSNDDRGNYVHLLVIPLEYRADRQLLGELRAREVMEFWATDHYTKLYKIVLERAPEIFAILRKHNLIPGMAPAGTQPMSRNKETVQKYMDAFTRTDHAAILSCLTEDVEWVIPGAFHVTGKDAFDKEIENDAFVGSPTITVTRMIEEGDVVVAEGRVRSARRDGGVLNAVFCDVFMMRDAKIRHLTSYLMQLNEVAE